METFNDIKEKLPQHFLRDRSIQNRCNKAFTESKQVAEGSIRKMVPVRGSPVLLTPKEFDDMFGLFLDP